MGLEEKQPSEFWKSINQLKDKNKTDPSSNISYQEWYDYFKNLMNINYVNNYKDGDVGNMPFSGNSSILNSDITTEEVLKVVKSLKNRKACGLDGINNEMLKISFSFNVEIYVNFFNLILKSGIYPTLWRG